MGACADDHWRFTSAAPNNLYNFNVLRLRPIFAFHRMRHIRKEGTGACYGFSTLLRDMSQSLYVISWNSSDTYVCPPPKGVAAQHITDLYMQTVPIISIQRRKYRNNPSNKQE